MGMDIRGPIGLMFALFGALLVIYGLVTGSSSMYERHSLGININLWWGLAILLFGAITLFLSRRGTAAPHSAGERPEGEPAEEVKGHKGH